MRQAILNPTPHISWIDIKPIKITIGNDSICIHYLKTDEYNTMGYNRNIVTRCDGYKLTFYW